MELVTEPVLHSAKEASKFARELQLLLRILGVSNANMERGEMRVEANISVSKTDTLGTKVEVKNLNSFKVVESAIEYEVKRQIALLEKGVNVEQETRGWDDAKAQTYSQRIKETADDYRYFPDPDITKYELTEVADFSKTRLSEKIPKLAPELRLSYSNLGLKTEQIETLLQIEQLRDFFGRLVDEYQDTPEILVLAGNYLTSDVLALLQAERSLLLEPAYDSFKELMTLLFKKEIGSRVAKDLLPEVIKDQINVAEALDERGLRQDSDAAGLQTLVQELISSNPKAIEDYNAGNENAAKFLVGQGMKLTKGAANPEVLLELIVAALKSKL